MDAEYDIDHAVEERLREVCDGINVKLDDGLRAHVVEELASRIDQSFVIVALATTKGIDLKAAAKAMAKPKGKKRVKHTDGATPASNP